MSLVHVGIRPIYKTIYIEGGRKYRTCYLEKFPDGSKRFWTRRMLKSGCNRKIKEIKTLLGLIYCPHCQEYFTADQFKESDDE